MPPKHGVAMRIKGWDMIRSVDNATGDRILPLLEEAE
jgi:hypothetical protein